MGNHFLSICFVFFTLFFCWHYFLSMLTLSFSGTHHFANISTGISAGLKVSLCLLLPHFYLFQTFTYISLSLLFWLDYAQIQSNFLKNDCTKTCTFISGISKLKRSMSLLGGRSKGSKTARPKLKGAWWGGACCPCRQPGGSSPSYGRASRRGSSASPSSACRLWPGKHQGTVGRGPGGALLNIW